MPECCSISVIIPTFNEAENIADVLRRVIASLGPLGMQYEVLVVDDDSPDGTAEIAQKLLGAKGRVIRRVSGKKGLSLSVLEGIKQAALEAIVVMDGDGSHPPELIPSFVTNLKMGYDLVIASRYVQGAGTKDFPLNRKVISRVACVLGRAVTNIHDNTSGFFCIRKSALEGADITPRGFKIGLEVFVKTGIRKYKEIPYIFTNRQKGSSKLKGSTMRIYIWQLVDLLKFKLRHEHNKQC